MKNSYKFFSNKECSYFPCHDVSREEGEENFNCLFCYCPLYLIKDCGGNAKMIAGGVKDCSGCVIPHRPQGYSHIQKRLGEYFAALQGENP